MKMILRQLSQDHSVTEVEFDERDSNESKYESDSDLNKEDDEDNQDEVDGIHIDSQVFISNDDITPITNRLRVFAIFVSFLSLGMARTMQGPALFDLTAQINIRIENLKWIFAIGTVVFPLGNVIGGWILERVDYTRYLGAISFIFMVAQTAQAFTNTFYSLMVVSALSEFSMGLLDIGCNVATLNLIKPLERGTYFTSLYFAFGLGNVFGPALAESLLQNDPMEPQEPTEASSPEFCFNDLQVLHSFVGGLTMASVLGFTAFMIYDLARGSQADTFKATPPVGSHLPRKGLQVVVVTFLMSILFCCVNGINYSFSNFLTVFVMRSLGMTKSRGSKATTIFFLASVFAKMATIIGVTYVSPIYLLCGSVLLLATSSFIFFCTTGTTSLFVCAILVGISVSSLFSPGLLWLNQNMNISSRKTSIFLITSSIGAQVFKIPIAGSIEADPNILAYYVLGGSLVVCITFGFSFLILKEYHVQSRDLSDSGKSFEAGIAQV